LGKEKKEKSASIAHGLHFVLVVAATFIDQRSGRCLPTSTLGSSFPLENLPRIDKEASGS
jgi:hypothetical protein